MRAKKDYVKMTTKELSGAGSIIVGATLIAKGVASVGTGNIPDAVASIASGAVFTGAGAANMVMGIVDTVKEKKARYTACTKEEDKA